MALGQTYAVHHTQISRPLERRPALRWVAVLVFQSVGGKNAGKNQLLHWASIIWALSSPGYVTHTRKFLRAVEFHHSYFHEEKFSIFFSLVHMGPWIQYALTNTSSGSCSYGKEGEHGRNRKRDRDMLLGWGMTSVKSKFANKGNDSEQSLFLQPAGVLGPFRK